MKLSEEMMSAQIRFERAKWRTLKDVPRLKGEMV